MADETMFMDAGPDEEVSSDISELFSEISGGASEPGPGEGKPEEKKEPEEKPEETPSDPPAEEQPPGEEPAGKVEGEPEGEGEPETPPVEAAPEASPEMVALQQQIADLTSAMGAMKAAAVPEAKPEKEDKIDIPAMDMAEMFKDVDFDKVMDSKEAFLGFLSTAIAAAQNQTAEKILSSIPNVVGGFVQRQAALRDVATDFYKKYPELKRSKRYVQHLANEVQAENPGWQLGQILDEAATRAKATMGVQAKVESGEKKTAAKPTLPGGTGGAKTRPKPSKGMQSEIDSLLDDN